MNRDHLLALLTEIADLRLRADMASAEAARLRADRDQWKARAETAEQKDNNNG